MKSKFADFINKIDEEDINMSSKQLDILIAEIRGLREDIKLLSESSGSFSASSGGTFSNVPHNTSQENSSPEMATEAQETLFGMPIPKKGPEQVSRNEQNDIMAHAGKILS